MPDEASANYLMSLLNKGLIKGDRRQQELRENGRVNY